MATSSSDGSPVKEESFLQAMKSQVDQSNIEDIIQAQKKSYFPINKIEKKVPLFVQTWTIWEKQRDAEHLLHSDREEAGQSAQRLYGPQRANPSGKSRPGLNFQANPNL